MSKAKARHVTRLPGPSAATEGEPLGRRQRQRLATRERIYQTALEEFERDGISGAQIDRIVEKAGVARGTFYFHFPTKEHVLLELQHRAQREIVEQLESLGDAPESVQAFCRQVYDVTRNAQREHAKLRREILAMYVRQSMGLELAGEALIVHAVDYFTDAAERGAVRRDIPPERLAVHFLSAMFVHFTEVEPDEREQEFVNTTIEIFARGVRP